MPPPAPKTVARPATLGACQVRLQLSMLLLPRTARENFWAAKAAYGPTAFGVFSCSKATNEVNFAAQKYARTVMGSNNIDSCNRT